MARKVYLRTPYWRYGVTLLLSSFVVALSLSLLTDLSVYGAWMLGINFMTLFYYRLDKRWSLRGRVERIPNKVLRRSMWIGGVVGAAAGMLIRPRHKTEQPGYQPTLLLCTLLYAVISIVIAM